MYNRMTGEVSELVDEHDLGSCAARRVGSSPSFPRIKVFFIFPLTLFTLCPNMNSDRARRGGSGALNSQSALARLNSDQRTVWFNL